VADLRIVQVYAERYLDRQPPEFQQQARNLIAQGKCKIDTKVIWEPQDVTEDAELGNNYVYLVLPDDAPPIELACVGWSKIATASSELLDVVGARGT
jgi:hypothetical protein